jgi:thiamine kinase-like enzyme
MVAPMDLLERLPADLGPLEGEPVVLGGGITNHNFRVRLGGQDYVLRVPGHETEVLGIDRTAEAVATEAAAATGIGPEVVARIGDPPALLTRFIHGRGMTSEDLREHIAEVARALRDFHESGVTLPVSFDVVLIAQEYARAARERGVEPPAGYGRALQRAQAIQAEMTGHEHEPVPCHNDLLAANFIHDGERIRLVDWEYAGMGDRYFDLGNFAVNNDLDGGDEVALLEAYWGEPPGERRLGALRAMRLVSDLREAMWGVVQSAVSELDFDFAGYAADHFDRMGRPRAV